MLLHGLEDNSITWVIQEVVEESLGFILADAGYLFIFVLIFVGSYFFFL